MALVNVGLELVRRGRRVLLIDFDLEAPGLTTYEALQQQADHPGVIEYVAEYIRTRESPDISRFLYPVDLALVQSRGKGHKARKRLPKPNHQESTGQLWVMPAGKSDAAYAGALATINWNSLYEHMDGYLFFEDTKLQWGEDIKLDYVLIDSRTGHTDVGGICTRQLADAVVLLFTPNEQNLAGLKDVCRDIRREETEGLKKKIRLHFVASNVPNLDDEDRHLRRHLNRFRTVLEIPSANIPIIHRNETLQMLDQPVFILHRPRSRLAREYRRLVDSLIMENSVDRAGTVLYLQRLQRERALRQHWRYSRATKDRLKELESQFSSDPEILLQLARWFQGQGDLGAALQHFDRVLTLKPEWKDLLLERGRCRRQVGDKTGAADDLLLYLHSTTEMGQLLPKGNDEQERLFKLEENIETALEELFDASFDAFLQALNVPRLLQDVYERPNSTLSVWFETTAVSLIRERRWKDAIRYLDLGNEAPKDVKLMFLNLQGQRKFYFAMAQWGETGTLSPDLCWEAADQVPSIGAANFQRLSLLYWGAGKKEEALGNLDHALATLANGRGFPAISCWTFREASMHEFRQHCEQQRRMIQGEPLRPAFLGPPRAPTPT